MHEIDSIMYTKADDLFYMQGIEKRASKVIWKKYQINRYELNMLTSITAYLQLHGKQVISRKIFTDWLGLNYKLEKMCWNYLRGLISKGAVHRLTYRNRTGEGNSLCVSPFGCRVLDDYYAAVEGIAAMDSARLQRPGYHSLVVDSNNLPAGYTLAQAGRS